jgi:hypothetical protein
MPVVVAVLRPQKFRNAGGAWEADEDVGGGGAGAVDQRAAASSFAGFSNASKASVKVASG